MTDKKKILAFLEGMSKGCCPNETKEIIINKIIPWINDLPEEPVSEDLEEAAEEYTSTGYEFFDSMGHPHVAPAFKAGAQWQKEKILSIIDDRWIANTANEGNSPSGKSYGERASEDEEIIKKIKEE